MALYRLAVVVDQQQVPDSDAEYQRVMDRILAVQPNNLFILQSKLRVALRRGDRAAARDTVERLKPLSARWSPQAKKQLADLDQALADPAAKVDLSKALLLMNLMRAEQGFRRDAAAVDADDKLAETALETFVRVPPPRHTPAEPDSGLAFTPRPIDDTLTGRWDALAPIWLNKGEPPAIVVASTKDVRIVSPRQDQDATAQHQQIMSPRELLPPIVPTVVLPVDWNNDFRSDVLLAGSIGLRFYEQQDDGSFTDVTREDWLASRCAARQLFRSVGGRHRSRRRLGHRSGSCNGFAALVAEQLRRHVLVAANFRRSRRRAGVRLGRHRQRRRAGRRIARRAWQAAHLCE